MKKLLITLTFCLCIPFTGFTQSSVTVAFDNFMLLGIGGQLKYAHTFKRAQVGAYVSHTPYVLFVDNVVNKYGISINSVPIKPQNITLYAGGTFEYVKRKLETTTMGDNFTETGWMIGPQFGMNINLANKHLTLNIEWNIRAGLYESAYVDRGYYQAGTDYNAFTSGLIGVTYTFKKKEK